MKGIKIMHYSKDLLQSEGRKIVAPLCKHRGSDKPLAITRSATGVCSIT